MFAFWFAFVILFHSIMAFKLENTCSKFHYEEQTLEKLIRLQLFVEKLKVEVDSTQLQVLDDLNNLIKEREEIQTVIHEMKKVNTTALQMEVEMLQVKVKTLEDTKQSSSGSDVYIRWGRTTCPTNGTEFVYKGYMAGAHYTDYGGGSNDLCLPEDPTWNKFVDGYNNGATIYGTEMELEASVSTALFGKQTVNQDIPCTVCRTRASIVMFPARATCYPSWTMEYSGYLISAHPSWKGKADYVCLDSGFEFVPHGGGSDDDHVVRPVEAKCGDKGGLPCPPYVDGRELACVVCSK